MNEEPTAEPTVEPTPEPTEAPMLADIVDTAVADGRFTTLVAAVTAAELVDTLKGEGPFTVFAPTDDAFAALPEGTVESLLADPAGALTQILLYHVVSGNVMAADVTALSSAATVQGEEISIKVEDGNVYLNDTVQVIITDIETSNGIIHVIDAVLMPPSLMAAELGTIPEIAAEAGSFTTLLAAVEAAGLAETLSGAGPFTVFAPTDDAFAALPEGTVESLLADPTGALTDILLYHVVEGAVLAETVVTLDSATTIQGEDVTIELVEGGVVLNGSVKVTATDVMASNGVIHVIDAVLLPPSLAAETRTIPEIAAEAGTFNTLLAAVEAAGLAETLSGEGPFTVFAPTDDAFAALPEGTIDALLADPSGVLTDILLYHVVEGAVLAEDVVALSRAATVQGEEISIRVTPGGVVLNGIALVTVTDIAAANGVIHVIDAVIVPPSILAATLPSIAEAATEAGSFTTLLAAVEAAGLTETLAGPGFFTVFAPTDEAFAALPAGTVDALLADTEALTAILLYHVVDGTIYAEEVVTLESLTTLQGQDITIEVTDDGVILNGTVKIVTTDIVANNGIIHVIDAVLLPPTP
jgi:uncharacterized surface protein with fasciclin (FAS1) repeats